MMVFKLKTGACMPPVHISIAVHSRFLLLEFLQEAAIIYLLASLGDRPRAYCYHHRRGQINNRKVSPFLSPQQDDVRRIGLDPLPRVLLLMLPNLVRVVDALVTVCSWNTNGITWNTKGIMVWAWMLG